MQTKKYKQIARSRAAVRFFTPFCCRSVFVVVVVVVVSVVSCLLLLGRAYARCFAHLLSF